MDKDRIIDLTIEEFKSLLESLLEKKIEKALNTNERPQKLLTRRDVTKLLHISFSTLHKYTEEGILTAHKIGGRVYYRWDEILAAAKRVEPQNPERS